MNRISRRAPRLAGHSYGNPGAYFVTVCTEGRLPLLADPASYGLTLTAAGKMVLDAWSQITSHYAHIHLDECIVMPDHFHGVIVLSDQLTGTSVSAVIGRWKSVTTVRYIGHVKSDTWPPFHDRLWQRSFHDRLIRDEDELARIRNYILENPARQRARLSK